MKFLNTLATLAISTIAAAHCMKKDQQLSTSPNSDPFDGLLPGSNLLYFCSDEDKDSSISISNLDINPFLPTSYNPIDITISGILRRPLDPASYVIIRDVVSGEQLNSEQILICPFLESFGHSCPIGITPFHLNLHFMVESLPDVKSEHIYVELYDSSGDQIICINSPFYNGFPDSQDIFMDGIGSTDL
ncbi:BgtE-5710 [Blumeria graminis f. sp. tritici]|uniref:BgtE-5710 n=3 Tax=Blumeria graminis TaxID=34373 RepID=A0A381L486_BLUGR|nr:putative secreted effector protein [Blumeria graminis f. sp. tritici 96224]VDB85843.1 BgtE-5710 [Blumeria graminis f. sp. tritici]